MQHGHEITIKCGSLLQEILENGRDEDLLVGVEGEAETGIQATIFYLTLIFLSFFCESEGFVEWEGIKKTLSLFISSINRVPIQ